MFDANSTSYNPLLMLLAFVAAVLFGVLPMCGLLYFVYFILTLPMRRRERARLFLYLLNAGFDKGLSPENAIAAAASSQDRTLGRRFYDLAALIRKGLSLGAALDRTPSLLPPRVSAMLKAGERIRDMRKVLPACNRLLSDGVSHVRGALNYLVLMAFVITPMTVAVPVVLRIKVFPSYRQVFQGMYEGYIAPPITRFVFDSGWLITWIQMMILLGVWIALILYVGGPRFRDSLLRPLGMTRWASPWTWKRLQRDFSAMLALLLDSGLAEPDAVRLAAEATASPLMIRRAEEVCTQLAAGIALPEALKRMDHRGELSWRINNALRHHTGFLKALSGWHESLDAKAFQLEQGAAQITTSALVLINGVVVAFVVVGVFVALIQLINDADLW